MCLSLMYLSWKLGSDRYITLFSFTKATTLLVASMNVISFFISSLREGHFFPASTWSLPIQYTHRFIEYSYTTIQYTAKEKECRILFLSPDEFQRKLRNQSSLERGFESVGALHLSFQCQ